MLVEYQDRLARFGFAYLVELLELLGVEVVITAAAEPEDAQADLVKDLLSIVTSFSARLYGMRAARRMREGFKGLLQEVMEGGQPQEVPEETR